MIPIFSSKAVLEKLTLALIATALPLPTPSEAPLPFMIFQKTLISKPLYAFDQKKHKICRTKFVFDKGFASRFLLIFYLTGV